MRGASPMVLLVLSLTDRKAQRRPSCKVPTNLVGVDRQPAEAGAS